MDFTLEIDKLRVVTGIKSILRKKGIGNVLSIQPIWKSFYTKVYAIIYDEFQLTVDL